MAHDRKSPSHVRLVAVDGRTLRASLREPIAHRHPVTAHGSEAFLHVGARKELPGPVLTDSGAMDADFGAHSPITEALLSHEVSQPHPQPLESIDERVPHRNSLCQHMGSGQELCTVVGFGDDSDMLPIVAPQPESRRRHFLKEWREYRDNMSQRELAARVSEISGNESFDRVRISKMERFETVINDKNVHLIAQALDISPGWLFEDPEIIAAQQEVLRQVRGLSMDQIRAMAAAAKTFEHAS